MRWEVYTQTRTPDKWRALLQLTRWRHHIPFVLPLTLMGALLAVQIDGITLDWRLAAVVVANILGMNCAFIINDVEDAPDDARDPNRYHDVINSGVISPQTAMTAFYVNLGLALTLYVIVGPWALLWGGLGLGLAYLYSARPYRLKGRPIVDVVTHALGGGALQVTIGYFAYDRSPGLVWTIIIAMFFGSVYGQFYNQIDDFQADRRAGLRNTTQIIGRNAAGVLMYASVTLAGALLLLGIVRGVFPPWLSTVLVAGGLACSMFVWKHDMRGKDADFFQAFQIPVLLVLNIALLLWFAWEIGLPAPGVA